MKRGKLLMSVLCCFMALFAFSSDRAYAMDFDAETAYESIFVIYSGNSIGSGFAIGSNTVVTNAHVIDNSDDIQIYTYEGDSYQARVYLIDNSFDIAILSVENVALNPMEIGDSDGIDVGDDIYAVGAPKSMEYTLTKGVVSNKKRQVGAYTYIQIDAAINSGNSGGPLLNDVGQVIGVNSMKVIDAEGIGLAIPMSSVISFIENNGIMLTENKTVDGETPFVADTQENDEKVENEVDFTDSKKPQGNILMIVLSTLLGFSVLLNVIFVIALIYNKTKNKEYFPDASERTDFDIDILE